MRCIFSLSAIFFSLLLFGQDVQWRGPERDGHYPDEALLKEWPEDGPALLLKKDGLGGGYSTPVLYEGMIYISGRRDSLEVLTALDLTGKVHWETVYGKAWMESFQETRNTPTIENGRVYISGTMGTVNCIDAKTGHVLWSENTHNKYKAEFHRWGMAESLLLTDNAVLSSPVGSKTLMVALDKNDGTLLWKSKSVGGVRSYVSPLLIEHKGKKIILAVTSKDIVGINSENGKILWDFDLIANYTERGRRINTNTPLYHDGCIFYSSGYDDTAVMLQLDENGSSVSVKWTTDVLDNHHGGYVFVDGYIYGANWLNNGNGNWVCLDWESGEVKYEESWKNKGSIIYADGMLYIFDEKFGNIAIVPANPDEFNVISSFKINDGRGPRWAHPSIYDQKLLLRHHDVLLVYDISDKS